MKGFASSIQDLLKGVRAFKQLANELKDIYPEIASILSSLNSKKSVNANDIRKAISFAVNKIMNDPYVILGVSRDDPPELIDAVYKLKVKFYHPDKGGDSEKFLRLRNAYDEIKNKNKKSSN